jgi:hypothetical protein
MPGTRTVTRARFEKESFVIKSRNAGLSEKTMEEFNLEPMDFKSPSVIKNHVMQNKFEANRFLHIKEQKYC